jgi:hypothetical protein
MSLTIQTTADATSFAALRLCARPSRKRARAQYQSARFGLGVKPQRAKVTTPKRH